MKLEALRQYAVDHAGDSADAKSVREITRWINAALRVCANAREWSFLRDVVSITLTPGVAGSYLGVTQDSDQLTLDAAQTEVFKQAWVDQQRILLIEGAEPQHYTISTILTPRLARLTSGQTWVADTDTAATYTVVRSLYDLPENTRQVHEVRLASTRAILAPYTVTDFAFLKLSEATSTGSPTHYTIRGDQIEVWPPLPTGDADQLLLTRTRLPTPVTDTSLPTTTIDWPDSMADLLERAVDVEIVAKCGATSMLNPQLALASFGEAMGRYKATDGVRQQRATSFGWSPGYTQGEADRLAMRRSPIDD